MRAFLARFIATLLPAPILALALAARALLSLAASVRLIREVFARARVLSRLIAARLRAATVVLGFAVRVLRTLAASTRLLRRVRARATEFDLARDVAVIAR